MVFSLWYGGKGDSYSYNINKKVNKIKKYENNKARPPK